MGGILAAAYGALSYLVFFGSFLYAIGFIENYGVPKTVDSGAAGPPLPSLTIDLVLLGVFALQHSVMARPAFKAWWTRLVPPAVERSTYVLFASLALILLFWLWQPLPGAVWMLTGSAAMVATGLSLLGWATVLVSTFLLSHFELFGLMQVYARLCNKAVPQMQFHTPALYRYVRHPIYFGFLVAFWAAPVMTLGHLVFAIATTGYIFIGLTLEERDLVAHFGDTYRDYRRRVSMILPWPPRS